MTEVTTDILVLGAGLAGMRAAWAAQEASPKAAVLIACRRPGPSGSSFANVNDALGMQVPDTDADREAFVAEVLSLGRPGFVDPALVTTLAEEAEARFRDIAPFNLHFRHDDSGLIRFPGCGSSRPGAYVFDDLRHAFSCFEKKARDLGVTVHGDFNTQGLIMVEGQCCGAWGLDGRGDVVSIRAKSVVMALGGPAPLYEHRVCGPASDGTSYAMLHEAGCRMENTGFLQFLWHTRGKQFVPPATLMTPGNLVLAEREIPVPEVAPALLDKRNRHCPMFHGHDDRSIDAWLAKHAEEDGFTRVKTPDGLLEVAPMAHAGNGGAVIDDEGATTVPGLFAAGECATGMHGANRLGGAMVLATQVFGKRAGEAAARFALQATLGRSEIDFSKKNTIPRESGLVSRIRTGMRRYAGPIAGKKLLDFAGKLESTIADRQDRAGLMARSALVVLRGYLTPAV